MPATLRQLSSTGDQRANPEVQEIVDRLRGLLTVAFPTATDDPGNWREDYSGPLVLLALQVHKPVPDIRFQRSLHFNITAQAVLCYVARPRCWDFPEPPKLHGEQEPMYESAERYTFRSDNWVDFVGWVSMVQPLLEGGAGAPSP